MRAINRIIISSTMFVVLLFSCKTTRYASAEKQTDVSEQKDISEQITETKSENSAFEINETENRKITVFSLPDSSGKQYVTSITEIYRDKTVSNKKNIVEEKETLKEDKSKTQKSENVKITEKSKTKAKIGWIYWIAAILGLGLICLIVWKLRR